MKNLTHIINEILNNNDPDTGPYRTSDNTSKGGDRATE
jgi:hypothetical protein